MNETMKPWDRSVCYSCEKAPAQFVCEKRSEGYPDLEADRDDMVKVPLCGDCRSHWEDEESMDLTGL